MALEVASRGLVMELGNVVLQGPAECLRDDERLADAYLGQHELTGTIANGERHMMKLRAMY